jgi:hypothetical protein
MKVMRKRIMELPFPLSGAAVAPSQSVPMGDGNP